MKRYLKHDRYELDTRESESLWYAVRRELKGAGAPARAPGRAWRSALATASVALVAVVAIGWWLGGRGPQGVPGRAALEDAPRRQVAQSEPAPRQAPDVAPSQGAAEASAAPATTAERPRGAAREGARPVIAAATVAAGVVTGRVVDQSDGSPVAGAGVLLVGTTRGVATDSTGAFRLEGVEAGSRIELQVTMLGYAPLDVAVDLAAGGESNVTCRLEPVVVAVAPTFDVVGQEYMVNLQGAVTEHGVTGETFQKYAIDSVEDALSKQAGVVYRAGELYVRGGRSGEVVMQTDGVRAGEATPPSPGAVAGAAPPTWGGVKQRFRAPEPGRVEVRSAPGSITGGTTPPNGERFESMYFEHAGTNPFVATDEDAQSTFALDVDNASFALARSYLDRGELPPAAAIRVEEFVNALDAGWPSHRRETFRIGMDGGPSRFGEGYHLLRIGIVARSVDEGDRKPANLVFVIDTSGSMDRENRLGAVKRALRVLVDELDEGDRVGIVTYGSTARVVLPLVDASRRDEILGVIGELRTDGATNAEAGLRLGYDMARRDFAPGCVNRLILCSDGVANTGRATDAEGILELARHGADDGIELSAVGFGMGNYNDVLMEGLADKGDGNYYYVDGPQEAERVFRENLTGMLQTVARQAKVQVEFDPRLVARWRLLGYENRDVADRDFRNDAVDAGEVGAGHQVTALYEVKLAGLEDADDDARAGVVRLRWEAPAHDASGAGRVQEVERPIRLSMFSEPDRAGTPQRRAQALAAEFAEILRGSFWAKESRLSDLAPVAEALARELRGDPVVQDLARMIRRAAELRGDDEHERARRLDGGDGRDE